MFEDAFYSGRGADTAPSEADAPADAGSAQTEASAGGIDPELLTKLLTNPEMTALLKTLANSLK